MRLLLVSLVAVTLLGCGAGPGEGDDAGGGGLDAATLDSGSGRGDGGSADDAGPPSGDDGGGRDAGDAGAERPRECAAVERCDDGLDGDCDGAVDEGCACEPGAMAACFRGDPRSRAVGDCRDGRMTCVGGEEFGEWGPCEGDVLEMPEVCDAAGADEDCDGAPNEGCECAEGDVDVPCGTDTGECVAGIQRCVLGERTACAGAAGPEIELCDGDDNDCDGIVDEFLRRACGTDEGICRMGTEVCDAGAWGQCAGGQTAAEERCDDLDNDCDGAVDEDVRRACGTDVGRCVPGVEVCIDGAYGICEGRVDAIGETCNGVDDDCDGSTDEGLTRSCGTDVGECRTGVETCADSGWGACAGQVIPAAEVCDGVADEDCDGTVDEGCACTIDATRGCGLDAGECRRGTQTCASPGAWGPCEGDVGPTPETCDGALDQDCDDLVDEGCDCATGATRPCGFSDEGECALGLETCDGAGRWGVCVGETNPSPEDCNGLDDDCDASTDEGGVCPMFPPTVSCPGAESVVTGETATLVGGGSDPDGGPVTFAWTVVSAPPGSGAAPSPDDAATTTFTPDVDGSYTLRLCVTDEDPRTTCCTATVTATPACTPPAPPTISVCPTSWDRRPIAQFDPLPAGMTYELFFDGGSYAALSTPGDNYHRPAAALAAGGPPPGTSHTVFARACRASDPTCCATSNVASVELVEACTTPVAPSASNIVFSEYVPNGDGTCSGGSPDCEAGEAIEITNLGHCPVALDAHHFSYCSPGSCSAFRWMNFGPGEVIPPRGVYVAIRNASASMCAYPFFGPNDPGLFGLQVSTLAMEGSGLQNGWFNNSGGGMSTMRIATGAFVDMTSGTTLEIVSPYSSAPECSSVGFDAIGACGEISPLATPSDALTPNQLGRLWHPCDAVTAPQPASCM